MGEATLTLPSFGPADWAVLWIVFISGWAALAYGAYLVRHVLKQDPGPAAMVHVARAIEQGSMVYLGRQVRTMLPFVVVMAIALYLVYRQIYADAESALTYIPIGVALAFLMGVTASYGAGYVGMWLAVKGNVRSANAALTSFKKSMELAFQAGAVSGMFTVAFGLLGATVIFLVFRENATKVLVGFGFGGSLAALFLRVGGGIYTKAADVGGDLVGKVEAGIPEDDPRNPATIADNVGDNVGDCAGMAADVFESYEVTLVAGIILAAAVALDPAFAATYGEAASSYGLRLILFPLLLRAVGVFSSILGVLAVRVPEGTTLRDPMRPINMGYWVSSATSVGGFFLVNALYLVNPSTGRPDFRYAVAASLGIALSLATFWLTNHFTHPEGHPVTETAASTRTGPATVILSGMAQGMESTVWAIVTIGATIIAASALFPESLLLGAYGVALAGLGLLATTGFLLAMDTYGPITDNAHGIFEMARVNDERASQTLSWMDAIGNTTKALTKGLAIATAVLAAVSLFRSFTEEAHLLETGIRLNISEVLVGLAIGGAVPFLFSALAIKAVSRAAYGVVEEVRRQFRERPGILTFSEEPDYARCVDIVTAMAQKELLGPAVLAVFSPLLVGFALGAEALGGFLGGAILTGQLLAVYMANTGANWDNAKKKIEDGYLGGKGTDAHKAAIIGDTVGDPYKDTAGPALNPLIKVMNLVAILVAPFVIQDLSLGIRIALVAVALLAIAAAVAYSKRGSIAEAQLRAGDTVKAAETRT
ncbi:MAG: sodium-translocating pyrophosphatase [Vicinamibacteria bacterium]